MIQTESKLLRAAILLVLLHCVINILPFELVLQFDSNNRNTVDGQNHINRVSVIRGILELTGASENISSILLVQSFIKSGLWLEIADLELYAHICNSVS